MASLVLLPPMYTHIILTEDTFILMRSSSTRERLLRLHTIWLVERLLAVLVTWMGHGRLSGKVHVKVGLKQIVVP